MNLNRLLAFVTVAEEGNMSRAAVRLHVSQPALSRRIHKLEQDVGFKLFERVGRAIQLTGQGEDLLRYSRDIVARTAALQDRADALKGGDAGILRVGASSPILDLFFPHILARYREIHPQVNVQLVENGSIELLHQLERGEIHLAVSSFPTHDRFESEIVAIVPILAAIAHSNRLSASDPVEASELVDEPLLLLRSGYYTRVTFDAACRIAHVQPRISFESNSPQTLISLAETDFGVAVVPATVRVKSQDKLSLRPIMSAGRLLEKRISINWDRCRNQPPYATSFIKTAYQCIHEQFRPVLDTFSRQVDEQVGRLAEVAQGA